MEQTLAEIRMFAGNFAPRGWALCEGQLLPINANQALFSLLGTTYGGDGRTTFALPDLRGRAPIAAGNGPGLPSYPQGRKGGSNTTTMTVANMPSHSHTTVVKVNTEDAEETNPTGVLAKGAFYSEDASANSYLGGVVSGNTGSGVAFNNNAPSLGINYIIALTGTFPSRS